MATNVESWQAFVTDVDEVNDPEMEAKIIKVLLEKGWKLPGAGRCRCSRAVI